MKNKKVRNLLAMLLVAAMTVLSAGCGGSGEDTAPAEEDAAVEEDSSTADTAESDTEETASGDDFESQEFIVGISNENSDHPHLIKMRDGIVDKITSQYPNVKVITTDGGGDVATQVAGIEDMVAQGADLIVIQAGKADAIISCVHELDEQGIPYMFSTNPIHGEDSVTVVSCDNALIGKEVGEYVVDYLTEKYGEPKGNVLILEGITGSETNELRVGEFRKVVDQYEGIEIGASLPAEYRRQEGYDVMSDMLTTFEPGTIDVIYSCNGEMAIGAAMAIDDAGRTDEGIAMFSVDGSSEEFDLIREGKLTACWTYSACVDEASDAIIRYLKGEELDKEIVVPSVCVTKENVDTAEPAF